MLNTPFCVSEEEAAHSKIETKTDDSNVQDISIIDAFNLFFWSFTHVPGESPPSSPRNLGSDCQKEVLKPAKPLEGVHENDIKAYFRALEYGQDSPAETDSQYSLKMLLNTSNQNTDTIDSCGANLNEPLFGHFVDMSPPATPKYSRSGYSAVHAKGYVGFHNR